MSHYYQSPEFQAATYQYRNRVISAVERGRLEHNLDYNPLGALSPSTFPTIILLFKADSIWPVMWTSLLSYPLNVFFTDESGMLKSKD